jgi:hypothetical protein
MNVQKEPQLNEGFENCYLDELKIKIPYTYFNKINKVILKFKYKDKDKNKNDSIIKDFIDDLYLYEFPIDLYTNKKNLKESFYVKFKINEELEISFEKFIDKKLKILQLEKKEIKKLNNEKYKIDKQKIRDELSNHNKTDEKYNKFVTSKNQISIDLYKIKPDILKINKTEFINQLNSIEKQLRVVKSPTKVTKIRDEFNEFYKRIKDDIEKMHNKELKQKKNAIRNKLEAMKEQYKNETDFCKKIENSLSQIEDINEYSIENLKVIDNYYIDIELEKDNIDIKKEIKNIFESIDPKLTKNVNIDDIQKEFNTKDKLESFKKKGELILQKKLLKQ